MRYISLYGHDEAAHRHLRRIGRDMMANGATYYQTPVGAFNQQRQSAKKRGIKWALTLAEWWSIWQESGKWPMRGRGHKHYVMSRYEDIGAYETVNVFIQLADHNGIKAPLRDRLQVASVRKARAARHVMRKELTLPVGVHRILGFTGRRGGRPYYAHKVIEGFLKHLGSFATIEEAEAAYMATENKS